MHLLALTWARLYIINYKRPLSPFHEDGNVYYTKRVVISFMHMNAINWNKLLPARLFCISFSWKLNLQADCFRNNNFGFVFVYSFRIIFYLSSAL
jgi:hypothetical protein